MKCRFRGEAYDRTIGWAGADFETNPAFPETFSSYISAEYRKKNLSLILKQALYSILVQHNIPRTYIRIEADRNQELVSYFLSTGAYRILPAHEIDSSWKKMCQQCELYRTQCMNQIYLEADVHRVWTFLQTKLGKLNHFLSPKSFLLQHDQSSFMPIW